MREDNDHAFFGSLRIGVIGFALLALGACAGVEMKGYTGPSLPADQTAIIQSGPYTDIERWDGLKVFGLCVAVLPGEHTVEMTPNGQSYREYLFYSWVNGSVTFSAQAGHKYLVYVDFVPDLGSADESRGSGYTRIGYIQDMGTGEKLAKTDRLPPGVERREYPTGIPNFMHR